MKLASVASPAKACLRWLTLASDRPIVAALQRCFPCLPALNGFGVGAARPAAAHARRVGRPPATPAQGLSGYARFHIYLLLRGAKAKPVIMPITNIGTPQLKNAPHISIPPCRNV